MIVEKIDKFLVESNREPDDIFLTAKYPSSYGKQDSKDKAIARKIGYKDEGNDDMYGCEQCEYYSVYDEREEVFGECRNKANARKAGGSSWLLRVHKDGGCPQFELDENKR